MATLNLQPDETASKDTAIRPDAAVNNNYGVVTQLVVGNPSSTLPDRSLLQFDLSSLINRLGVVVTAATVRLWCESEQNPGDLSVFFHRSLVEWFEGARSGSPPLGGEDGSTWNHRNANGSVAWSGGAGGGSGSDFVAAPTATVVITAPSAFYDFNVLTDVQAFVANTVSNHGWFLLGVESNTTSRKVFSSSSHATTAQRPEITVDYTTGNTITGTSTVTGTLTNANTGVTLVEIQPAEAAAQDTYISAFAGDDTKNFGVAASVAVGEGSSFSGHILRTLIKFDLSSIPDEATILSATLSLYAVADASSNARTFRVYRLKRAWVEGTRNGTTDSPATGATWNRYNTTSNWQTAGGFGTDDCEQTDIGSRNFSASETLNEFKHFPLVGNTKDDLDLGNGWLIKADTESNDNYSFASSSNATSSLRPKLTVTYAINQVQAAIPASSTIEATLVASGNLQANIAALSSVDAFASTNEYLHGNISGSASTQATGILKGYTRISLAANSVVTGTIRAEGTLVAAITNIGVVAGDIQGEIQIASTLAGSSTVSALPDFAGHLRSSFNGFSTVTGLMWGKATGKAVETICDPTPLLYLTDGTTKINGQKNLINFLSKEAGFLLKEWRPQIAQYKEGGRFSSGPLSQGRRLRYRNFENIIDVFELSAFSHNQDALIEYTQELLAFQEAAADYWVSDYVSNPIYLVAKAARETNERYAIVHMISVPELANPYSQSFYNRGRPSVDTLTIRIEHGHWLSTPPGDFESVEISSIRSWTVSGWETGS